MLIFNILGLFHNFAKQIYEEKFIYTIIMRIVICLYGM